MHDDLTKMAEVAKKLGVRPEYVQGGGGNVSVKRTKNEMAIKASGFRLDDLGADHGFVSVDHAKIRAFYEKVKGNESLDVLTEKSAAIVRESTLPQEEGRTLRPSIETGFHSFLGKSVVHTHSVYANILNCSAEGKDMIKELFPEAVFVPYSPPGVGLTLSVRQATGDSMAPIIFLQNHGLIVEGDTPDLAYDLHEKTNARIQEHLGITEVYPVVSVKENGGFFISDTPYLSEFILRDQEVVKNMKHTILFPDQVVYGDMVGFDDTTPISIDLEKGAIHYKTGYGEARAFEEMFVSWAFIIEHINKLGLTLKTVSEAEGNFIFNMEGEKYRKKMI